MKPLTANELRIGNFLTIENELLPETVGKLFYLFGIEERYSLDFPNSNCVLRLTEIPRPGNFDRSYNQVSEYAKPIPLTEEWLVRFGFEANGLYRMRKPVVRTNHMVYFNLDHRRNESDFYFHGWCFKYVHQLQNLYHALTGEELTMKEL